MIRRLSPLALMTGLFIALVPGMLSAQFIEKTLDLEVFVDWEGYPIVHSFARSILYNANGTRIYNKQVILGHQVLDETHFEVRFNAQIVSEIGYANSTTRNTPGEFDTCYSARMATHVNAYNLHVNQHTFTRCLPAGPIVQPVEVPEENCPIILDLEQDGFHLSAPDPSVRFDIDADGILDEIAWTKAGEDDAFLCLDRNSNGIIDDGSDLFGYSTLLLSGERAIIGYRALADLDALQSGGNADGKVDTSDSKFRDLCVWVDQNRNGVSEAQEMSTLDQAGVVSLEYAFRTTRLRDSSGNFYRYVSRARMRTPTGTVRNWPTFDVIFAEAPSAPLE